MALTPGDIAQVINGAADDATVVRWTKPPLRAAAEAVHTVLTSQQLKDSLSTAIDTATAPFSFTFTAEEKRMIVKWVLKVRFDRGND